ncbi:MAG: PAS domain-containing sensor histidine kinase [Bacillota bacterium]
MKKYTNTFVNDLTLKIRSSKVYRYIDSLGRKLTTFRIVLIYIVVGSLWVLLSDRILKSLCHNNETLTMLQTFKGWFFIAGTAWMLYLLIDKSTKEIRKSKEELKSSEERYELVINNTTDGLWEWNIEKRIILFPLEWKRKLGYDQEKESNFINIIKEIIHPDDKEQAVQTISDYLSKKTLKYKSEFRLMAKDGRYFWFLFRGQAIWSKDGTPLEMVGTITDISDRKCTEEALKKTMEENRKLLNEVIEYDKLKTEFFSNISHEFRTPLNVILGTIQVMDLYRKKGENSLTGEKMNKYMTAIKQNCYRLLRLINNLIDVTRIDTGFYSIQPKNDDIVGFVRQIAASVEEFISVKSLKFIFYSNVSKKVVAFDRDKIERVILNLISNAVKFTKPGGSIFLSVFDLGDNIRISVRDTGIGIDKDKLELVFERFRQVNSTLTRDSEGSGIGLSLVKSLVEMHEGSISIVSEPGEGTEFIIILPAKRVNEEESIIVDRRANGIKQEGVERIKIEFSDIYF